MPQRLHEKKYLECIYFFQNGCIGQRRQPDDITNLAERIGLGSRYYIKNITSSDQLVPDDSKTEMVKESIVHLLDLNPMETAAQIMVEDFTIFRQIEMTEYIDNLFATCKNCDKFVENAKFECTECPNNYVLCGNCEGKGVHKEHILVRNNSWYGTPNLSRFGELVNQEMYWVITEIVSEPKLEKRVKIMKQFIKVRTVFET